MYSRNSTTNGISFDESSPIDKIDLTVEQIDTTLPVKIRIPKLDITLNIVSGNYDPYSDNWDIYDNVAHLALPTNSYMQKKNMLIYGHNSDNVFGNLDDLYNNDTVQLIYSDGSSKTFMLKESVQVSPNNVTIFTYNGQPRLTLLTCTGLLNELRALYHFSEKSI